MAPQYGAMEEDEAIRLKQLEQENARLKRIVAEQALDISMLKDPQQERRQLHAPTEGHRRHLRKHLSDEASPREAPGHRSRQAEAVDRDDRQGIGACVHCSARRFRIGVMEGVPRY